MPSDGSSDRAPARPRETGPRETGPKKTGPRASGPRGPIAWARRRPLPWLAALTAWLGLLVLLAWGLGRWFSDDHLWSQYLSWIPTPLAALFMWLSLLCSWGFDRVSRRSRGVLARPLLALLATGVIGWWLIVEVRPERGLGRLAFGNPTGSGRIVHWNMAVSPKPDEAGESLIALDPDIALVMNTGSDWRRGRILGHLEKLIPPEPPHADDGKVRVLRRGGLTAVGRWPIRRWGIVVLTRVEGSTENWRSGTDPGRVIFLEYEAPGWGEQGLMVWVVDFPSDPAKSRRAIMEAARAGVESWRGPHWVPDELGRWRPESVETTGFPEPDVVIGDFNAPRGARSVRRFVGDGGDGVGGGGLTNAYTVAGWGGGGTWPRVIPGLPFSWALWQLDQAFVGERVKADRYRAIDLGGGAHLAQELTFSPTQDPALDPAQGAASDNAEP